MTHHDSGAAETLHRVPFPRYSVGLLQSESEMLQAPEHDLLPALELDARLDVELFTERTVQALIESADRFDVVVVGYNATHRSEAVRAALAAAPLPVGLLVLHQFRPEGLAFLTDEPLIAEPLSPPAEGARLAAELDAHDEILLNWPEPVELVGGVLGHSTAHLGVTPSPDSRWRTVLEITAGDHRLPVLVRTHSERWPPRAACSVLLAPRHPAHRALLANLLMWCAAGRPSAVVVETPAESAAIVHRKLRLQGVKAVVEPIERAEDLDFRRWPLWGTRDVLLPEAWDPTRAAGWPLEDPHATRAWLRRGHRIVLLGPGDGLTIRHGESDAHWVARRWATWFAGVAPAAWHGGRAGDLQYEGSIVAVRSVLRMLAVLHEEAEDSRLPGVVSARAVLDQLAARGFSIDAGALGLPRPSAFAEPVAQLLRRRVRDDSVDLTMSATVAALDIDVLLGGAALDPRLRKRLLRWLERQVPDSALEDRLNVARFRGDPGWLRTVIAEAAEDVRVDQPVSAVLVTALRSAIVACGLESGASLSTFSLAPERAVVDRELRMRPMLAATYLIGVLDLQHAWPPQPAEPGRTLRDPPTDRIDRAVVTLGRHGPLGRGLTASSTAAPELASTEALALMAYFARHPVPTHVVRSGDAVPPQALGTVLREAEQLRRENERLDQNIARRTARARQGGQLLAIFGEALILGVVALFALTVDLDGTWEAPSAFVLWTLLTLGLLALLGHAGWPVRGARRMAPWLAGGLDAVRGDLATAVASEPDEAAGSVPDSAGPARVAAP